MQEVADGRKDIGKRVRGVPCLHDLDVRSGVMDQFAKCDCVQVLESLDLDPEARARINHRNAARLRSG